MARARPAKGLFDEPDDSATQGPWAEVVFNRPLATPLTYHVPAELAEQIAPGKRVLAPLGRGGHRTTGYCVAVHTERDSSRATKPIVTIVDEQPLLSPAMLELTRWMAEYYAASWGQVLEAVLPRAVKSKTGGRWALLAYPAEPANRKTDDLTARQRRVFELLVEQKREIDLKEFGHLARCGPELLKTLIEKGWIAIRRQRIYERAPKQAAVLWTRPLELNPHQAAALGAIRKAIEEPRPETFLLHGVTGSGKTEVYLQAITSAVERGREAIVLVPEISLTPQTIERFRGRFSSVAVLHSHLSDTDRHWYWQQIASGQVQVVVGARSALFAPCRRLGIIILDEEHETTFKQESTPRYHARTVAWRRAKLEGIPLVLGSATPSLETWHAAQTGRATLLSLPQRVGGAPMPRVEVVDLREQFRYMGGRGALSRPLVDSMRATLDAGGQVMLLLNRRGYSTSLLCPKCGRVEMCHHCDIALTFHRGSNALFCHSCDAEFPIPLVCPECQTPEIRYAGIGTERLEAEVRARFPEMPLARMDSDTMRSLREYEEVLRAFQRGETRILLGTQMIAKGLDFPNVRLVGVISADTARNLPDFRASERTFQLLAQVAGRSGRGSEPGRVVIQTFNPEDPAVLAACRHDYHRFVTGELSNRERFHYPPYQYLARLILRATEEEAARESALRLAATIRAALVGTPGLRILGPAPAPVARIRDYFRWHIQVHASKGPLAPPLVEALQATALVGATECQIDIDPVSLL